MLEARRKWGLIFCVFLCAIFAAISWCAIRTKSPTQDEPSHAVTGWFNLYAHDYRLSPDVPPIWEDWIALDMGRDAIHYDPSSPEYRTVRVHHLISGSGLVPFDVQMLYRTPPNDGMKILADGRFMALLLGVVLAGLIGLWAGRLGGAIAAVAATFVYCFDPNFIAHSPLVKNDVPMALVYLAASYAIWRAGRNLTWLNLIAVLLLTAAAVLVKFSGLILAPLLALLLGLRALDRQPWPMFGRLVSNRARKLAVALAIYIATALFTITAIWASYGFRFNAGPNGLRLDINSFLDTLRFAQVFNAVHHPPSPEQQAAWIFPVSTRAILYAESHHLMPQAWLVGSILTQSGSESRLCYLAGTFYNGGRWDYFPRAALYKSPLATIIAFVLAAWIGVSAFRRGILRNPEHRWTALALLLPAAAYAGGAITSNVNIGLRHAFPVYPFVFIAIGLAAGRFWTTSVAAKIILGLLAVGLAAETLAAFPNYINFFDVVVGQKTGYDLLSDSNIDWGQDLPALADWQHQHPNDVLYLNYFGRVDPAVYGIRYQNLLVFDINGNPQGAYPWGPPPVLPSTPGVLAISATNLHLAEHYDPPPPWYGLIKGREPEQILNGSIYLFRLGPR